MRKLLCLLFTVLCFSVANAKTQHKGKHVVAHKHTHKHHAVAVKKNYDSILIKHNAAVTANIDSSKQTSTGIIDNLLTVLEQELGKPYRLGSNGPTGFDCSGLIKFAFSFIGFNLPRTAADIGRLGDLISLDDLHPGDLLFFKGRSLNKSRGIGHVGCVYKVDSGKIFMIHSSEEGVNITDINSCEYYKKRLICAKRIFGVDSCISAITKSKG